LKKGENYVGAEMNERIRIINSLDLGANQE
jgi:hypothetical protein